MTATRIHTGLTLPLRKPGRASHIEFGPSSDEIVLPLNQHGGGTLRACVVPGDAVHLGQVVAEPESDLQAALHAPVSGRVIAIEPRACARFSTYSNDGAALSIVIANDHTDKVHVSCRPLLNWSSLSPLELCRHLARGGIVGLGGAVFSTATKLSAHTEHDIDTLIINGVECEPYITCDDRLMRERASTILSGVRILLHASQAKRALLAIEADKPEAIAALRAALLELENELHEQRITLQVIPHAYPGGDEGQLITRLLGCEIPRGGLPTHIGVVVQNVATAYACARWILDGQPLISRVVTVTGSAVRQSANLEVRIGTSMAVVLSHCGGESAEAHRFIMGGAMMGVALHHAHYPVTKATNCLIAATEAELPTRPAEQPCIRCGECMEACPVGLLPQQLLAHSRKATPKDNPKENSIALEELGLRDCIECGCCDYVCPSHIQLVSLFRKTKQRMVRR